MRKVSELRQQKLTLLKKRLHHIRESFRYYKPYSKQLNFHKQGKTKKERLFLAGNRCGKTYCGAMEMAMHLTGHYPVWWQGLRFNEPIQAWAASITVESTRDILQKAYLGCTQSGTAGTIPSHLILNKHYKRGVSNAVDTVYIQHKSGGVSALGFKSYDQGREKFQGTSKHFIHLDEEPEIRLYEECLMRTLDVSGSLILTMTPLKGMTDICQHYLQNESVDKAYISATWDDTEHLSDVEKVKLRSTLRPHELEAREKGVPSLGSGKVYPIPECDVLVKPFKIPSDYKKAFAMDFGWSNPTAIVWAAKDMNTGKVYIYDAYTASERTPAEHACHILKRNLANGVCDPAGLGASQQDGKSLIEQYMNNGVYLTPADNNVEAGVMQVLDAMREGKLKVFSHLEGWLEEFRLYRRLESGKICKKGDHLMDATRYLITSASFIGEENHSYKRKNLDWTTV